MDLSEFAKKRDRALELLTATGMSRSTYLPLATRFLWKVGVKARPPHFVPFGKMAAISAAYFMAVFVFATWIVDVLIRGRAFPVSWVVVVPAGLAYGIAISLLYEAARRKHTLPRWNDL